MAGMETVKEWVETIREDIEALKAVLDSNGAEKEARKFAAAGLNYLVARMDLVPDWEESIGVMDDVFVLRIAADLAGQHGLGDDLSVSDTTALGRLTNESDAIENIIDAELYAHLRTYVARLVDDAVRGRTPAQLVDDEEARKALYADVDADLKRIPPAPFADPDQLLAKFKSYLHHKLDAR